MIICRQRRVEETTERNKLQKGEARKQDNYDKGGMQ